MQHLVYELSLVSFQEEETPSNRQQRQSQHVSSKVLDDYGNVQIKQSTQVVVRLLDQGFVNIEL